jgi:hypothetical protein
MADMNTRPGYKTTEFWLTLIAVVIGFLVSSDMGDEATWVGKLLGIAATVLAALGYSVSRAMVKSASLKNPQSQ